MEETVTLNGDDRNDTGAAAFFGEVVDRVAPAPESVICPCCGNKVFVQIDWALTDKHFEQLRATANIMWMYFDLLLAEAGITQEVRDRLMHDAMSRTMVDFDSTIEKLRGADENG